MPEATRSGPSTRHLTVEDPIQDLDYFDNTSEEEAGRRSKPLLRDFLEVIVFALALYIVIQAAVQTVHVVGESMMNTLLNDNLLIAVKVSYWFSPPQRGDIIIFKPPLQGADPSKDYIKRVIGLPGEYVHITNGVVYINGHRLDEPYLPPEHNASFPQQGGDYQVPRDHYFVMGDNREHSSDSRVFCAISRDSIEGRAILRIWPLDEFGLLLSEPVLESDQTAAVTPGGRCP
jgi:signal peptidase I